jgi:hypothetical protein
MSKSKKPPTNTARETEDPATAVAAVVAAERCSQTVATVGLAATPVEQPAAARTGKVEAASPVLGNSIHKFFWFKIVVSYLCT